MSQKELCMQMLDRVPAYKLGYVIAFLQGLTIDEDADDAFCEQLYQQYLNDPDPEKDVEYSLDECKQEWGLV